MDNLFLQIQSNYFRTWQFQIYCNWHKIHISSNYCTNSCKHGHGYVNCSFVVAIVLPSALAEKGAIKSVCFASTPPRVAWRVAAAATFQDLEQLSRSQGCVYRDYNRKEKWFALWTVPPMFDWCQGLGMCVHTVLPNSNCKMCSQSILLRRFLSRGKSTQFGWLKSVPSHLVLPHLDTSFIERCAVAHSVASQDEGPCFEVALQSTSQGHGSSVGTSFLTAFLLPQQMQHWGLLQDCPIWCGGRPCRAAGRLYRLCTTVQLQQWWP